MINHPNIEDQKAGDGSTDRDLREYSEKPSLWYRAKKHIKGETGLGRVVGIIGNTAEMFLPKWVSKARDVLQSQLKTNRQMNWLKNRLKEKSTWRGVIAVLTALGVSFSPEQKEAVILAGVAVIGVFEAFFKEPQSEDTK